MGISQMQNIHELGDLGDELLLVRKLTSPIYRVKRTRLVHVCDLVWCNASPLK
jgi:hypothetical protein